MAAYANMTIADALGTPVNHTYAVANAINGVFRWEDRTAASNPSGVPIGFGAITIAANMSKDVNAGRGRFVLDYRMVQPVLETVSNSTVTGILPAAIKGYECAMFIKFIASSRSTGQNRADLFKMGILGFQNTQVSDWCTSYTWPT
jgi:hypothetical protein